MASLNRTLRALALCLGMLVALPVYALAPNGEMFFNLRLGKLTIPGEKVVANKEPVQIKRGGAIGFYYQDAEIVNVARVLTQKGELMLETRSLDPIIWLSTENLPLGTYKLEILSGTQKAEGSMVVKS